MLYFTQSSVPDSRKRKPFEEGNERRQWICRLDRKRRFVLPEFVRRKLGLDSFALIELEGDRVVVRRPNGEMGRARPISRNLMEICDDGLSGVMERMRACGEPFPNAPGSQPGRMVKASTEKQKARGPGSIPGSSPKRRGFRTNKD